MLERQQMAAHTTCQVSGCVHVAYDCERLPALDESYGESSTSYVPVALSLMGLAILIETKPLYYSTTYMGKR